MITYQHTRMGAPGSLLISRNEKKGHVLRFVFFAGLVTVVAFPAIFIWWAFNMEVGPTEPGDSLPGIEALIPMVVGIFLNPGLVMIAGSLSVNTQCVSRIVAASQPGEFSPELWQSCGRWRGWFFPGLDLLRNDSQPQGIVALGQWIHVALGWFFAIPLLPAILFFVDPFSSGATVFVLWLVMAATIPFGIYSVRATGRLWRNLSIPQ